MSAEKKIKVGVIFGGRSGEHEVSIVSARSVMGALDKNKYEVIPIGITKTGEWVVGDDAVHILEEGLKQLSLKSFFVSDPTEKSLVTIDVEKKPTAFTQLDVIFPVVHGTYGEDGTLQGMLELANVAYVGAGVLGSAVAMDKVVQKHLTEQVGIPNVAYQAVRIQNWEEKKDKILTDLDKQFVYPIFTKPANLGSSVGITKCHNLKELEQGIEEALRYDTKCIVEQGVEKAREIEVAVLGNENPKASVPGEIIPSNEFYDYDAKYVDGKSTEKIPADLPADVVERIQQLAVKAFTELELSGMARVDFLLDGETNDIYLNEVNTIPGFTAISMYPKLWEASGVSYTQLLDQLVELAQKRYQQKNELSTTYQPKNDWHKKK